MKIDVKQITFSDIGKSQEFPVQYVLKIKDKDLKFGRPISGKVVFIKLDDRLIAKFNIKANLESQCVRCLDNFILKKNLEFNREYSTSQVSNKEDILVVGNDFTVDINGSIREEIILDLPMKLVCKKNCKGLCDQCGVNLNKKQCKCKELTEKNSFDKLKKFRKTEKPNS